MAYPYRPHFFLKCPDYIPPTSEEDAQIDPRVKLEPACNEKCKKYTKLYDECVERVTEYNKHNAGSLSGPGHCLGQHYDVVECVDKCLAKDLFRHLK
ncbi:ubiquinol-cytochrome c reductase hinge, putative [Theileria equi strain WA]|uniref:Ubiquinol-cytochrome c reductase hinge, putative n=1 Tax=Theileria equi strain WA TaxID=1537102 RepID=L0B071_THEEQ|nr:ubiquinol-cytochrome c reductase hinge, putative [Theileria equi strain WA]AFZ81220.1 ubiquinol-cytochrome c reductase hinge, putative [Theileria equi strain WA]|eukprot:XP_004830886.1 ubiquinol-cytochrome c reductase hinge, putative [Theileria equi strain WA]